jgi:hypothetical protein
MKERKGPLGEVVGGIAQGIAGTVKRRQQDREPKVILYDPAGLAQTLPHGAPGRDEMVATAGRLIELANGLPRLEAEAEAAQDEIEIEAAERDADAAETTPPTPEAEGDESP